MIIEAREDTVTLRGAVKSDIWPAIQAAAAMLLQNHPTGIIIDCTGITDFTTQGAETFAGAFNYISAHDARIIVVGLSPELMEVARAVPGVRSQVPVAGTVEEARASLRLEEPVLQRGKARIAGVAPILGNWRRAVYFADKLAMGENAEIHLIDLIRVPRTLPMGTPLPEREATGQQNLQDAQALVKETKLKSFTHTERVRSESAGLIDFVKRLEADYAVVSVDSAGRDNPRMDQAEAMSLLEEANFEVSLLKGSPSDESRLPESVIVPAVGAWEHAVEHACKLALTEGSSVTVVCIISVPRSEPIDAPKPDAEAAAADCAREVTRIAKRYNVKANATVERVRDPVLGFMKLFQDAQYDLAVIGAEREILSYDATSRAIAAELLQELPCEVMYLRAHGTES